MYMQRKYYLSPAAAYVYYELVAAVAYAYGTSN
jgi:hypothetical protein